MNRQMIVKPYETKYFPMIQSWGKHYGLEFNDFLLPKTGLIIEDFAVGFLYFTETPMCLFENLCKNPNKPKDETDKALDLIASELTRQAEIRGCKLIVATTIFEAVANRALNHGYRMDENKYTHLYRSF
jgi:hypothetical protein